MNKKITLSDIAILLAEQSGKDKKNIELFLHEFIATLTEGLQADKIVKVKGLGTFKIILVEKRESVNVNTGERFLIPEHYKYSFLPEKELKELVNKPFSLFEATEINENVSFLDLEESEEEDFQLDEELVDEEIPETILIPEMDKEEVVIVLEEPLLKEEKQGKEELITEISKNQEKYQNPIPGIQKKTFYKKEAVIAPAILILFIVISVLIYNRYNDQHLIAVKPEISMEAPHIFRKEVLIEVSEDTIALTATDSIQNKLVVKAETIKPAPTVIDYVTITSGSRLTLISLKYYRHKLFWVYLFQANKAVIANPNNIPIGTVIKIPAPEIYGINAKDRSSLEKAAVLQTEILTKYP